MRRTGRRLVIDGNAVYEIDESCTECRQKSRRDYMEKLKRVIAGNPGRKGETDQEKIQSDD